jgi:hypothetical protein
MKRTAARSGLAVLLGAAALLVGCLPRVETVVVTPTPPAVGVERVGFSTHDEAELSGYLYGEGTAHDEGDVAVVLTHMESEDQGSWEGFAREAAGLGYTALTFDFRCYPASPCVAAGAVGAERNNYADLLGAIGLLRERGFERIVCMGADMGAEACINVSVNEELAGLVVIASPTTERLSTRCYPRDLLNPTMPKLFVIAADDPSGEASVGTRVMYGVSPEPRQFVLFPGDAHGTELFATGYGEAFRDLLLQYLAGVR